MTPEQKAFYEYGKARGILAGVRKEFVVSDVVFGISKQESITSFRKNHPLRRRLVKDAWQKRAVCRRVCGQCAHFSPDEWGPRKDGCLKCYCWTKGTRCAAGCQDFEFRKEVS